MLRSRMLMLGLAALLALGSAHVSAQDYPAKPIVLIVPFSAGGAADTNARIVATGLDKELGQRVIVENVTGAGGTIGLRRAAQSAPDGYTMAVMSTGASASPALYKDPGFHPLDNFETVGLLGITPTVLVVRKDLPVNTISEFVAYLKTNSAKVTLAHVGPGSMTHLSCTMFNSIVGINPTAVSYRGTPPLMQDLVGGRVDYTCQQPNGVIGFVKKGDVKALVVSDRERSPSLPETPNSDEAGMPDYKSTAWSGLVMPKGTPDAILSKVNAALGKVLNDKEVVSRFATLGVTVRPPNERTREFHRTFLKSEMDRYTGLMRGIGVKPQ